MAVQLILFFVFFSPCTLFLSFPFSFLFPQLLITLLSPTVPLSLSVTAPYFLSSFKFLSFSFRFSIFYTLYSLYFPLFSSQPVITFTFAATYFFFSHSLSSPVTKELSLNINLEVYKDNVSEAFKDNFKKIRKILPLTDWSVVENETDINESWEIFYEILNGVVLLYIPVCKKHPRQNNKPKWWKSQIEARLLHKKHAHHKYLVSQNVNDRIKYERLRCESWLDEVKKDLEIYIANKTKSNPKEFYKYVLNTKKLSQQILVYST